MILLDPDLDIGSSRKRPGLLLRPVVAASPASLKPASPTAGWQRSSLPWAERLPTPGTLRKFLSEAQQAAGLSGQVTVLLTTDKAICSLNARFRGKNKPTDILSFASTNPAPHGEEIAGDLAISVETARKQAAEQGHTLGVELRVLILHGLLHLAGYDHDTDAGRMQRRERQLRARLGLPQGLIERAASKRTKTRRCKP